jgi:Copper transport outer membrane protein, MctB
VTGFRYHALALTTSVVTLAVGVVVGVGPLSEAQTSKHQDQVARLQHRQDVLSQSLAATRARAGDDHALAQALAGPLTADRLKGRTVVVVATPGADRPLVRRTIADLKAAGATVTGTVSLSNVYVDPGKAQSPLEDLVLRLVPPGVTFTNGSSAIERVGTVLARSTVTAAAAPPAATDQKAAEVIAGLSELGALQLRGVPGRLAQFAVVVAGPPARGTDAVTGARDALLGLVAALDKGSRGVVVVGSVDAARPDGLIAQVRTSPITRNPSTVDTGGSVGGDLALVLALAEQAAGRAGDYGRGAGADALVPDTLAPDTLAPGALTPNVAGTTGTG